METKCQLLPRGTLLPVRIPTGSHQSSSTPGIGSTSWLGMPRSYSTRQSLGMWNSMPTLSKWTITRTTSWTSLMTLSMTHASTSTLGHSHTSIFGSPTCMGTWFNRMPLPFGCYSFTRGLVWVHHGPDFGGSQFFKGTVGPFTSF